MPKPLHILIVAGDPSGDEHAAQLVAALRKRLPGVQISALGGAHLKQSADHFLYPLVGLGGFGFWEPILKLPHLWAAWKKVKEMLANQRPDVVIPVDYYGFNIHIARLARKQGIPVVYYVSPQVWASRPQRIKELAKVLNKILVIFPFEEAIYRQAGVPVRFVGHPLLDRIPDPAVPGRMAIGLLPGSRWGTVERHLPILIETARRLRQAFPDADFLLFRPSEIEESQYQPYLAAVPWIQLVHEAGYEQRKRLSLAIGVSGTAALENTLLGIPMIVMYKLSPLTYTIAKQLIHVPFVAIPNILAGRAVIPEMLQADATPEKLTVAAQKLLNDPVSTQKMRQDLLALRAQLGERGSTQRAADEIAQVIA